MNLKYLALTLFVVLSLPGNTAAQLAPTGGHYAGRGSDTGHGGAAVSPNGTFAASVQLELPPSRRGLPVPVSLVYGAKGFGVAGVGWDVPQSYVRLDTSFAHRRPRGDVDPPEGREQVTVSLLGQQIEYVREGDVWVPRRLAPGPVLRQQPTGWILHDGGGLTYTFTDLAVLGAQASAPLDGNLLKDTGMALLDTITGAGSTKVQLGYQLETPALAGGKGISIDLVTVDYNSNASLSYKHQVKLIYDTAGTRPLSLSVIGARALARMRKLTRIEVGSRSSAGGAVVVLRSYALEYAPDLDSAQPRLKSVTMAGQQGTAEAQTPVPVATYEYGTASTEGALIQPTIEYGTASTEGALSQRTMKYELTQSIKLPPGADTSKISSTEFSQFDNLQYVTAQDLVDVTGDGRPDLVFQKNNGLWVARNRPGADGKTVLDNNNFIGSFNDVTMTSRILSARDTTQRYPYDVNKDSVDEVWRKAIDVNGDGRVDIIDAQEQKGYWTVYLNTPHPTNTPINTLWKKYTMPVEYVRKHLAARGHIFANDDFIPIERRYTGMGSRRRVCYKFDFYPYNGNWHFDHPYPCTFPEPLDTTWITWHPQRTYTEWELRDFNGDGYADLVMNSSPVGRDTVVETPNFTPTDPMNPWGDGWNETFIRPSAKGKNGVDVAFNAVGRQLVFTQPVRVVWNTECGTALSRSMESVRVTCPDNNCANPVVSDQTDGPVVAVCEHTDVNGDGLPDRVQDGKIYLGTGREVLSVQLTDPPGLGGMYHNRAYRHCKAPATGTTTFNASGHRVLRDMTGDGIPDLVVAGVPWTVRVGTGVDFGPPIPIDASGHFHVTTEEDQCDGKKSKTLNGLYDIDGDGRPEVVELKGDQLDVYQLVGSSGARAPEAGRLIVVDNGHGAATSIAYKSAKEDGSTLHQVPFPEIVVTSVRTRGKLGLGGTLSPTRYAFGGAELIWDPLADGFRFPGYTRSVELRPVREVGDNREDEAVATFTDSHPRPTPLMGMPPLDELLKRYLLPGRPREITVLSGILSFDPWTMLAASLQSDPRRRAGGSFTWGAKAFGAQSPGSPGFGCWEFWDPYESQLGGMNVCTTHGFLYQQTVWSWRGDEAPPSNKHVATQTAYMVDDFGRITNAYYGNDAYKADDDVCVATVHANATTGPYDRVLTAPASRRVTDCGPHGAAPNTLAMDRWEYDGLAQSSISTGLVTSHTVEVRDAQNGSPISVIRDFDASYDALANPITITRQREDGASRTLTTTYDPFGLAAVLRREQATGAVPLETRIERDAVTLQALGVIDPNQTRRGSTFDGFGRPVLSTLTPAGGSLGVTAERTYVGFGGGAVRLVIEKTFSDPVPPGSLASASGQTVSLRLDELGRQMLAEISLGPDYGNQTLTAGARSYDGLGRVVFEAEPYLSNESASAYGTTQHYNVDGTPSCMIRGYGWQPLTNVTDQTNERYPTCISRRFENYIEVRGTTTPDALLPGSPQYGVGTFSNVTAIGRVLERSTWRNGVRLDRAQLSYDRLGHTIAMTRWQEPVAPTNPVTWSWRYDSRGLLLQMQEPDSVPRYNTFSHFGELIEARAGSRREVMRYDGFGRLVHREELDNGVLDLETVNDYEYDVGVSIRPDVTATNVLGRLAHASAPSGEVFFSYDEEGRVRTRTYTENVTGDAFVETSTFHADGKLAALGLQLPDNGHRQELFQYRYDSAGRPRSVTASDGSSSQVLYDASNIDLFGRVREAKFGEATLSAGWAEQGRRLPQWVHLELPSESRGISYLGFDPAGRELSRQEKVDGGKEQFTTVSYDALGRIASWVRTDGVHVIGQRSFSYDAIGNVTALDDLIGQGGASVSYQTNDRDRACRINYGPNSMGGLACNVAHDDTGNVVEQATRNNGHLKLEYFPSGRVRWISDQSGTEARFRYDPFGDVQELDVHGAGIADVRRDRRYGDHIERHDALTSGDTKSLVFRNIPIAGMVASRRGAGGNWVFELGEQRGKRLFVDHKGRLVQEVDYQPYGEASSKGELPGSPLYTSSQWNGGDALAAFGISRLGARLYDPVIGRFLSRDPLVVSRTAAATNPYAFAANDPINLSDPTGLDYGASICTTSTGGACSGGDPSGGGGETLYGFGAVVGVALWLIDGYLGAIHDIAALRPTPQAPPPPRTSTGMAMKRLLGHHNPGEADWINWDNLAAMGLEYDAAIDRVRSFGKSEYYPDSTRNRFFEDAKVLKYAPELLPWGRIGGMASRGLRYGGRWAMRFFSRSEGAISFRGAWTPGHARGAFTIKMNEAGGKLYTSRGMVTVDDFAQLADAALARGETVNILTGVHGLAAGRTYAHFQFYLNDLVRFGRHQNVFIHNFDTMSTSQITALVNGPQTTFGAFCYSGICLHPFQNFPLP